MKQQEEGKKYIVKVGRRKTSVARVRLFEGKENSVILTAKGELVDIKKYYASRKEQKDVLKPLVLLELSDKYYFSAKLNGGGRASQIGALVLGLSRCLASVSDEYAVLLRHENLLSRDSRMVERKKIYHKKARKSPQYSKR